MAGWDWLIRSTYHRQFVRNVILKVVFLMLIVNALYILLEPLSWISKLTLYNHIFPGRERFPYSDNSPLTYSVTLSRLEAMFASHVLAGRVKAADEFRVILIGDSTVWGWLLDNNETLSACLNAQNLAVGDGRRLVAYNLGYPALSAVKDAIIMQQAREYSPDLFVWLITLQTLWDNEQLRHPVLRTNSDIVLRFLEEYDLALDRSALPSDGVWQRSIVGQRRDLADLLRHQVYGVAWAVTGLDHTHTKYVGAPMQNLPESDGVLNRSDIEVGDLPDAVVRWDVLRAGMSIPMQQGISVLLVNEPIFISGGLNSHLRYNQYYPRWAYDLYRERLQTMAFEQNWDFLDIWNIVPPERFTDTPFHFDASATCDVAAVLAEHILHSIRD